MMATSLGYCEDYIIFMCKVNICYRVRTNTISYYYFYKLRMYIQYLALYMWHLKSVQ